MKQKYHPIISGDVCIQVAQGQPRFVVQLDCSVQKTRPVLPRWQRLVIAVSVVTLIHVSAPSTHAFSADEVIQRMNMTRGSAGIAPLHPETHLMRAAESKATNMSLEQYFGHTSPSGITPWSWFRQAGYRYTQAGENLAKDFASAEDVVAGWMYSPRHRENVLDQKFSDVGVAVLETKLQGKNTRLIVAEFGTHFATLDASPEDRPTMLAQTTQTSTSGTNTPKAASPPATATEPAPPTSSSPPPPAVEIGTPFPIPSILAGSKPVPNLQLTYVEPARYVQILPQPKIHGASIEVSDPAPLGPIAPLVTLSLGLSFSIVAGWAVAQKSWLQPTLST